jgi:hypothetical protein
MFMTTPPVTAGSNSSSFSSSSSATSTDLAVFLKGFDFVPKQTYLTTIPMLEKYSVAKLGTMNDGSYDEFIEKMNKIAKEKGIMQPILGIGIKYKPKTHFLTETAYPIIKNEWDTFKSDPTIESSPTVYIVDRSKHVLPL